VAPDHLHLRLIVCLGYHWFLICNGRISDGQLTTSANFEILVTVEPRLVRFGGQVERYFGDDPNTCLLKVRQFGEAFVQLTAAKTALFTGPGEPQAKLLRRLKLEKINPGRPASCSTG
jgi:hypothetical protein